VIDHAQSNINALLNDASERWPGRSCAAARSAPVAVCRLTPGLISRVKGVRMDSFCIAGFCDIGSEPAVMYASGYGVIVGTSRRWTGADAGIWRQGDKALAGWAARSGDEPTLSEAETESIGQAYLADLRRLARSGSELGPVRDTMLAAGEKLPDAIESVMRHDMADCVATQTGADVEVLEAFTARLDVAGGTLLDAVVRRAARMALTEAGKSAGNRDLFCLLYRLFFAQTVSQLITAVIAEKIKLAVPGLHMVDAAGTIASWIAKKVFSLLPNPCDIPVDDGGSVKQLADALLHETVDRALGLSAPTSASGGA
jgi:hypothetical protein